MVRASVISKWTDFRPLQILGKALGIPDNAVRTFTEAEIRAGYDTQVLHSICCHFQFKKKMPPNGFLEMFCIILKPLIIDI